MSIVIVDRPEAGIVRLRLNRPDRLNALSSDLVGALERELEAAAAEPACRVIIITGEGRGFCAGLDLDSGFDVGNDAGRVVSGMESQQRIARALTTPSRLRVPVIAAVNGPATGGGLALALACDVRIAAASARFNAAFVRVGLSGCDCGVSHLLPRAVGASAAYDLMLTGRLVGADEALSIGLVSRTAADGDLDEAALACAREITGNSPFGVEMTKQVMWANIDAPSLGAAIELENRTQILCTMTGDQAEALAAFRERRQPAFERR